MSPPRHGFETHLELEAKHGYEVTVIGEGDVVAVEVTKPAPPGKENALERLLGMRSAVTAYVARGTVTPRRIVASFGKFGKLDLRFRPSGQGGEVAVAQALPRGRPLHQPAWGVRRWLPFQR